MNENFCLSKEITEEVKEKTFTNSIILSLTQIINNNNNFSDETLNILDPYKQFYLEVKKLVIEESLNENGNENDNEMNIVLNKIKEIVKKTKELKKIDDKYMDNKLGEYMEQQNDIKDKAIDMVQIDNIYKEKKLNNSFLQKDVINDYLPELVSPENNYKVFINSIKQFEYEEKIYDKYLTNEDLKILKSFPEKINKYLYHLKSYKRKKK